MKKTITRGQAVNMHFVLANMAFGNLKGDDLVKMVHNSEELRKVADAYTALSTELHKRLFDTESEEYKKFVPKIDAARKIESNILRAKALTLVKEEFPELYAIYERQAEVESTLRAKEVSIEIEEIDREAFVNAMSTGNPEIKVGAFGYLGPLFAEETNDLSELDELLK